MRRVRMLFLPSMLASVLLKAALTLLLMLFLPSEVAGAAVHQAVVLAKEETSGKMAKQRQLL